MSGQKTKFREKFLAVFLFLIALPIWLPFLVIVLTLFILRRVAVHILVWLCWLPRGKNVLLVFSDSPIWYEYMTTHILPLVRNRAVVLNWSERKKWARWSLAAQAFRSFGGESAFNPLVVVFRPMRPARVFRFWAAFKDWKHGRTGQVKRLMEELQGAL